MIGNKGKESRKGREGGGQGKERCIAYRVGYKIEREREGMGQET